MKLEVDFVLIWLGRHILKTALCSHWQISQESCGTLDTINPQNLLR